MSDLAEQIDALLALNAKGAVSHPVPGMAVELLTKAAAALRQEQPAGVVKGLELAKAALTPLAAIADDYDDAEDDDFQVWTDFDTLGSRLPLKRFRAAREALSALTSPPDAGGGDERPHVIFRRDAFAAAQKLEPSAFAGDLAPVDNGTPSGMGRTLAIVSAAYEWTVDDEGRLFGLVAGDQGYAATGIVLDNGAAPSPFPKGEEPVQVSEEMKRLRQAVLTAMDHAGTMPAREAVKVRPKDWRAITDGVLGLTAALSASHREGE